MFKRYKLVWPQHNTCTYVRLSALGISATTSYNNLHYNTNSILFPIKLNRHIPWHSYTRPI